MDQVSRIHVALDKTLIANLINGLYGGAKRKVLKVVIDIDGRFHVESKDLRMTITFDTGGQSIKTIHLHNEKHYTEITEQDIRDAGLTSVANDVVRELKEKFSAVHHSLSDSIAVFGRTYGGN
ncbi:MAG: hypothetical protein LBV27_03730 [Oscillospiraceae bacterium]|jgi:hypothetical protein|nr:hypothetical protein [Oscillospiraceae bacterium]